MVTTDGRRIFEFAIKCKVSEGGLADARNSPGTADPTDGAFRVQILSVRIAGAQLGGSPGVHSNRQTLLTVPRRLHSAKFIINPLQQQHSTSRRARTRASCAVRHVALEKSLPWRQQTPVRSLPLLNLLLRRSCIAVELHTSCLVRLLHPAHVASLGCFMIQNWLPLVSEQPTDDTERKDSRRQ